MEKRIYISNRVRIFNAVVVNTFKWLGCNVIGRNDYHAVTDVKPETLSLMFVGRTHEDWGYWTDNGYVNFDKHPHSQEFSAAMKARKDYLANATRS